MTLRRPAIAIAVTCVALQVVALSGLSALAEAAQCTVLPSSDCHGLMAMAYLVRFRGFGGELSLERMLAWLVPLTAWLAAVCAIHAPGLRSRAALGYGLAFGLIVGGSAMHLHRKPAPMLVPPSAQIGSTGSAVPAQADR